METTMSPVNQPARLTLAAHRYAKTAQWVSISLIVASLFLLMKTLPIKEAIDAMEGWIRGSGVWGPVIFGAVYVVATITLAPGSVLTLASGAIFGLGEGLIVVSLASTTGAALAFLIARYLAREKIARQVKKYPKFSAVDKAIGAGGWKIVAMLRLSPAIPFNLQNYLYGLTAIRFWPCIFTSWLVMLPGTLMYVYFGYIARQGAEAAAGNDTAAGASRWVMIGVGLIATVAVSIYITKIATRALKQQTEIEATSNDTQQQEQEKMNPTHWPWGATVAVIVGGVFVSAAALAQANPTVINNAILGLFGPPQITLAEAYSAKSDGPTFDHSTFDALLHEHVDEGWVNYENMAKSTEQLDVYIASLAEAPFDAMGRDKKLTILINAYNAFTLRLILDHYPTDSIKDIPASKRWKARRWNLGGMTLSLDDIENKQIRPKFKEARIHFALVCAAVGCPVLRNEAYVAGRLEEQLEDQVRDAHQHDRWFRFDTKNNTVYLTRLYKWYASDFEQVTQSGKVLEFVSRYVPEVAEAMDAKKHLKVRYLDYDWSLNSTEHAN